MCISLAALFFLEFLPNLPMQFLPQFLDNSHISTDANIKRSGSCEHNKIIIISVFKSDL